MTELLTKETFLKKVFNFADNKEWKFEGDKPCIIDFYADWCGPCKMMAPILEELKTEFAGEFVVDFIDVWKFPEQAKPYGVRVIPTQIFFAADGTEMFRHEGFFSCEDILGKWRELGVSIPEKDA